MSRQHKPFCCRKTGNEKQISETFARERRKTNGGHKGLMLQGFSSPPVKFRSPPPQKKKHRFCLGIDNTLILCIVSQEFGFFIGQLPGHLIGLFGYEFSTGWQEQMLLSCTALAEWTLHALLVPVQAGRHLSRMSETKFHTPPPLEGKIATDTFTRFPAPVVHKMSAPKGRGFLYTGAEVENSAVNLSKSVSPL